MKEMHSKEIKQGALLHVATRRRYSLTQGFQMPALVLVQVKQSIAFPPQLSTFQLLGWPKFMKTLVLLSGIYEFIGVPKMPVAWKCLPYICIAIFQIYIDVLANLLSCCVMNP